MCNEVHCTLNEFHMAATICPLFLVLFCCHCSLILLYEFCRTSLAMVISCRNFIRILTNLSNSWHSYITCIKSEATASFSWVDVKTCIPYANPKTLEKQIIFRWGLFFSVDREYFYKLKNCLLFYFKLWDLRDDWSKCYEHLYKGKNIYLSMIQYIYQTLVFPH